MAEMPGMIRPDLQALPQVRDRMTFLYLKLAQAAVRCWMELFPAHAGVIPSRNSSWTYWLTFPRTRGGDPYNTPLFQIPCHFSPHARG